MMTIRTTATTATAISPMMSQRAMGVAGAGCAGWGCWAGACGWANCPGWGIPCRGMPEMTRVYSLGARPAGKPEGELSGAWGLGSVGAGG